MFEAMREHGKIGIVKMRQRTAQKLVVAGLGVAKAASRGAAARGVSSLACVCLGVLIFGFPAGARGIQEAALPAQGAGAGFVGGLQQADPRMPGSVSGTIVDASGAAVVGAKVALTRDEPSAGAETTSDKDGAFTFASVVPGAFHVTVTAAGFAPQVANGI